MLQAESPTAIHPRANKNVKLHREFIALPAALARLDFASHSHPIHCGKTFRTTRASVRAAVDPVGTRPGSRTAGRTEPVFLRRALPDGVRCPARLRSPPRPRPLSRAADSGALSAIPGASPAQSPFAAFANVRVDKIGKPTKISNLGNRRSANPITTERNYHRKPSIPDI
jgi:hypothetical protein